jgi:hypothetical protein
MNRFHIAVVALLLAVAAVFGTLAATRTAGLGAAARHTSTNQQYAARVKQLNALEAQLRRRLEAANRQSTAAPTKIVYHRPPPVVVVRHTQHGDDGGSEHEGGGDD